MRLPVSMMFLAALTGCEQSKTLLAKLGVGKSDTPAAATGAAPAADPTKPANEVAIAVVTGSVADEATFDGQVRATERVEIRADRRVKIAKRLVEVRAVVKKGQPIIEADKSEIAQKLKELTDREVRQKLEMRSLDVQLEHKKKVLERKKILAEKQIIPLREYDDAVRDYKVEENNQASKRLDFEKLATDLAQARATAETSDVVSPIEGIVAEIASGNEVREGDQAAVVVNPARFSLRLPVDEQTRMRLKVGDRADVTLEADNTQTFPGVVAAIAMTPDASMDGGAKTFATQIDFQAGEMKLAEGYKGKARFVFGTAKDVAMVPRSAIRRAGGKTFVVVKGGIGAAPEPRDVELGVEGAIDVEIKKGVRVGEEIMVGY